jgi:hypothetical protein
VSSFLQAYFVKLSISSETISTRWHDNIWSCISQGRTTQITPRDADVVESIPTWDSLLLTGHLPPTPIAHILYNWHIQSGLHNRCSQ